MLSGTLISLPSHPPPPFPSFSSFPFSSSSSPVFVSSQSLITPEEAYNEHFLKVSVEFIEQTVAIAEVCRPLPHAVARYATSRAPLDRSRHVGGKLFLTNK